ncbi:MAG TPA: hypothetical protein VEQ65_09970 [Opitutus sp.]|nr:hypothetical protein [Opitutus sp.]
MNFAEIERNWKSGHNRPSAAELEKHKMKFTSELHRRHRGNVLLLALVFALLAFFTGKIALHVVWPDPGLDPVDLRREWGIIPFFALPWIGWLFLVHLHRRHRRQHANYQDSIRASLAALLDENRSERTRYCAVAVLLVASALVLPLIVFQLRAVGKAGGEILVPALVIYPAYVIAVLLGSAYYYRAKLLPRKRELEALLQEYADGGPGEASARSNGLGS